jgi:hypothetical protein
MDKEEFCKVCGNGILYGYATVCDCCKAKGYDDNGVLNLKAYRKQAARKRSIKRLLAHAKTLNW